MKKDTSAPFIKLLQNTATLIALQLFTVYASSLIILYSGKSIHTPTITALLLIATVSFFFFIKEKSLFLPTFLLSISIYLSSFFIASSFFDYSWDGMAYQKEAILCLHDGWNLVFQDSNQYSKTYGRWSASLWLDHYPSSSWIIQTYFFSITHSLEASKLTNYLFLFICFSTTCRFLNQSLKIKAKQSLLLSFIVSFNPVTIYQLNTFMVDGALYCLIVTYISSSLSLFYKPAKHNYIILLSTLSICINIKHSATPCLFFLSAPISIFLLYIVPKQSYKKLSFIATTSIISFTVLGFSPYISNTIETGKPFYPFPIKEVDYLSNIRSETFKRSDRLTGFFISNLSMAEKIRPPHNPNIKFPFYIYPNEFQNYAGRAGPEIAGFGPLYGGILLLTIIHLIILFATNGITKPTITIFLFYLSLAISIFFHKETWWARFIPHAWLFIIIPSLPQSRGIKTFSWLNISSIFITSLAITNIVFMTINTFYFNTTKTNEWESFFDEIKGKTVIVKFGKFASLREALNEHEITFTELNDTDKTSTEQKITKKRIGTISIKNAYWSPTNS